MRTYVRPFIRSHVRAMRNAMHAPDPGSTWARVVHGLLDERNVAGMHLPGQRAEAAAMRCKRASNGMAHAVA